MYSKRHTKEEVINREFLGCMYFHDEDGIAYGKHFVSVRFAQPSTAFANSHLINF